MLQDICIFPLKAIQWIMTRTFWSNLEAAQLCRTLQQGSVSIPPWIQLRLKNTCGGWRHDFEPGFYNLPTDDHQSFFSPPARWGSQDFIRDASHPPPSPRPTAPQPGAADSIGHCRTSTTSSRSQWALPDLNHERQSSCQIVRQCPC